MKWVILTILIVFIFFLEELYRYVFCSRSSRLFEKLFDSKGHEEAYYVYRKAGEEKLRSLPQQVFTMASDRGEALKGFYYDNGAKGKKIAFVVHGYRSDHADMGGMVYDYYAARNIDIFAPDHTGEGESQGHFIGFDVLETPDCLKWIDFLKEKFGEDIEIILHGFSMGAATVMQMSSRVPENVKFIVEDSGYRSAEAAMRHQVGPMYGPLRLINKIVAGYDWNDSDVTESLLASRIPILFIQGKDDKLVPAKNGPELYALYPGPKDCLFPEHTRHVESLYTSYPQCEEKLDGFLKAYMQ